MLRPLASIFHDGGNRGLVRKVRTMDQSQDLLKIGAVVERSGVSIDTIRYHERRGLLSPAQRLPSGYRLYRDSTVSRVRLARRL